MLDNLRTSLGAALKKLVGASDVNEELIDSLCKDVQRALLQSDVNVRLVLSITQNLKKRSMEETPPKGLSRKDHIVSILYDELSRLMGYTGDIATQNKQPEKEVISFTSGKTEYRTYVWYPRKWKNNGHRKVGTMVNETWIPCWCDWS